MPSVSLGAAGSLLLGHLHYIELHLVLGPPVSEQVGFAQRLGKEVCCVITPLSKQLAQSSGCLFARAAEPNYRVDLQLFQCDNKKKERGKCYKMEIINSKCFGCFCPCFLELNSRHFSNTTQYDLQV